MRRLLKKPTTPTPGILHVIVNGKIAYDGGTCKVLEGVRAGKLLKRNQ